MNLKTISLAIGVPIAAAAVIVAGAQPQPTLHSLSLTNTKVYVNTFRDNLSGDTFKVEIPQAQFDRITKQNYQPTYPNAVWVNTVDTFLFNTGTTTLQDNQIFVNGDITEVKLPNLRDSVIKSDLISNGEISVEGTQEVSRLQKRAKP